MSIKAILFDLDGTLVDSSRSIARQFLKALQEKGVSSKITEKTLIEHLEWPFEELNEEFGLGMDEEAYREFIAIYRKNYLKDPITDTEMYPGAEAVIRTLKERGYRIALATGKQIDVARRILKELGLDFHFDWIQGHETGLKPKPEPDILKKALDSLGLRPIECVMVGDTHVDILAAQALSMKTVAVTYGFGKKNTLEQHKPDYWLHSLSQLPKLLEEIA